MDEYNHAQNTGARDFERDGTRSDAGGAGADSTGGVHNVRSAGDVGDGRGVRGFVGAADVELDGLGYAGGVGDYVGAGRGIVGVGNVGRGERGGARDSERESAPNPKKRGGMLVGVIGAKGGIGTSSLAASLAVRAQERSVQSCVVDLQFASPIDAIFSMEQAKGVRWGSLDHAIGNIDAEKLNSHLLDYNGVKILSSSINYPKFPKREIVTGVLRALKKRNEMIFIDTPKSMITKEYGSEGLLHLVDRFLVLSTRDLESVLAAKAVVNLIGNKERAILATFFPRNAKNSGTLSLDNVREFTELLPIADMSYENKIERMLRGDGGPEFKKRGHYRDGLDSLLEVLVAEVAMTF